VPEFLMVLMIVLLVVTVVGHLIWITLAWFLRLLFGQPGRRLDQQRPCPFCERRTRWSEDRCEWCGRELQGQLAEEMSDLAGLRRQLKRLREAGVCKPAEVEGLLAEAEKYRRRLLAPPPAEAAAAAARAGQPVPSEPIAEPREEPIVAAELAEEPAAAEPAAGVAAEPAKPPPREVARPAAVSKRAAVPKPPPPPAAPKPPRKSWAETLAGFLEERNIHWAELIALLVGGLLLVGPSVALVISLWPELERIPYLKSFIFVAYSSVVFLAGLYAHHRWKLQYTGRGLLTIAALLVPLNFLAMASLSQDPAEKWSLMTLGTELISLGIFVYLVSLAARVLVLEGRWLAVLGVAGNSAAVLAIARLGDAAGQGPTFVAAGGLPAVVFAGAVGGYLYRLAREKKLDTPHADSLFTLLGTAVFSLAVALGLLVAQGLGSGGRLAVVLDRTSVPIALAATAILAAGLTVIRGVRRQASLAAYRTAGTIVALVGITGMIVALGLAWPQPWLIIAVGGFNAAALVFVAFRYRLPIAEAGAIASAAAVYLVSFHLLAGDLSSGDAVGRTMLKLAYSAQSGGALVGFVILLGLAAEFLARFGYRRHARQYAGGAAVVAGISLVLVTVDGFRGPDGGSLAMAVYAVYGAGSLLLNARFRQPLPGYLGLGLLVGATLWALWLHEEDVGPIWAALLAAEAVVLGLAAAVLHRLAGHAPGSAWKAAWLRSGRVGLIDVYRVPLLHVAEAVAPLAVAIGVWTAWSDSAAIVNEPMPVLTAVLTAAFYMLFAWGYRSAVRTYVGSSVALVGLIHTFVYNYAGLVEQPWLDALLGHATLAVLASVLLGAWTVKRPEGQLGDELRRVFIKPLGGTALGCSCLALAVLPFVFGTVTWSLAACLCWLAAIWLVIAWTRRWSGLAAAAQVVLTVAVVVAGTAWLREHPWSVGGQFDPWDPRSLQTYGIGLGLLTLAWVVARLLLRSSAVGRQLFDPGWPAVDRLVGYGVAGGQLLLVVGHLLPCFGEELMKSLAGRGLGSALPQAVGSTAWLLVGVLALALAVALWDRWRRAELAAGLLVAATVPCLIAASFAPELATASALRWGLGVWFIVSSVAIWQRARLGQWSSRVGARIELGPDGPSTSRAVLLGTTAAPVVLLTLAAALLQLTGTLPGGPVKGSFFDRIGPEASYLVPLLLVTAGLVGFALREASAGFAFSAGLVAEMIVTLGYALGVVNDPKRTFAIPEFVTLVQLATITAAVWAVGWLAARRRVNVWREGPGEDSARVLMNVQLGMAALAGAVLLAPALLAIALFPEERNDWTSAVGAWPGWLAMAWAVAAVVYRPIQMGRRVQPQAAALGGMAVLGLLASSIHGLATLEPWWAYRTLMLGWATYSLFVVLATWWVASLRTLPEAKGPPQALIRAAAVWVSAAGLLAVCLGLKAAVLHERAEDLLWAAAAIAVASAAGAAMAVWRRREGWAFAAAPGANVAASLVVWYYQYDLDFERWFILLVQANVIASAAVALLWLAARRRLYELRELSIRTSPLLAVQTLLGVLGGAVLLIPPVVRLALSPQRLPDWAGQLAEPPGWIAVLLVTAAAAWYLRQVSPRDLLHVIGGLGLGVGVLTACTTSNWNVTFLPRDWLAVHVLTALWTGIGLLVLAVGWCGGNLRLAGQLDPEVRPSGSLGQLVFPSRLVLQWVTFIGALGLGFAVLWCHEDPQGVWWRVGSVLGVSLAAGLLAVWQRLPLYVYLSGLLINVAGTVLWIARGPENLAALVQTNVLCLAIASGVWSLVGLVYRGGVPALRLGQRRLPFAHAAVQAGLGLCGLVVGWFLLEDLWGEGHTELVRLSWIALGAIAAAAHVCLWDRQARFPLAALYFAGLIAVGIALDAGTLEGRTLCWTAGPALAGFVLAAGALGWLLPRMRPLWQAIGIPGGGRHLAAGWFGHSQAAVAAVATLLSVWISIDFAFDDVLDEMNHPALSSLPGRMAGPLAAVLLLVGLMLTTGRTKGRRRADLQLATLGLGALILAELGWAWLGPQITLAWLHRNVILMVAAVVMTLIAGFGLRRVLPQGSEWIARGRQIVPILAGIALAMLAVILVQEMFIPESPDGVHLVKLPAVVVVAAALVGLIAAALSFAVLGELDPLGLSDRGRTAYVYAAEVLGGLVGLHLWLTRPELFDLGIVEDYWMLMVVAVAFGGAGVSELFHRRGLPVLSQPLERTALLLPLGPAIGFWLASEASRPFAGNSPALWFLGGLFLLAMSAGVVGLWVLWHQLGLGFLQHPQLWLIPVGLIILVAEYLNSDRLSGTQSTGLRYLALSLIYVSSSTEFLRELGQSLWLPLVLIGLSVLGVLVGIVLRIRSFIYLGVTFLAMVIVTLICYAGTQDHMWVVWTFCIILGAAIIALFAVFEKRRTDILAAVGKFRQWER